MILLKLIGVFVILHCAAGANLTYNYDTIKAINDLVLEQKSNSCVILVIEGKVKFVTTEADSRRELAKLRDAIKDIKLPIIKATFQPLTTTEILEKLAKIGEEHLNFLVYFTANTQKPTMASITTENMKTAGLLGNLLGSLGLKAEENGLLNGLLSLNTDDTPEKKFEIIPLEN